jgi:hypothetical protein
MAAYRGRSTWSLCAVGTARMTIPIAERKLLFSEKGRLERKPLTIRIFAPRLVEAGSPAFHPDHEAAGCIVEFDGLPGVTPQEIFGGDTLQALQLSVDVEPVLKRLSKTYDFYFPTGEGYFDE